MSRRRPDFMRHLRFRGDVRLGPVLDPDRRRRVPPTASIEEQIDDVVGWMIAAGFDPVDAKRHGEWYRDYHRRTGTNLLALPPQELLGIVVEADRQLDELEREEAEELADGPEGESEH